MKLPSTPDTDYMPEMLCSTPDQDTVPSSVDSVRTLHHYFKQQHYQHRQIPPQHPSVIAAVAADIPAGAYIHFVAESALASRLSQFHFPCFSGVSTPDSSQTDSDDVSPQIQRKRKSAHQRDILPRFSISIEDDHSGYVCMSEPLPGPFPNSKLLRLFFA